MIIIEKNINRVDYDYQISDKDTVRNKLAYKYKNPYKGPYEIIQTWNNGMVRLHMAALNNGIYIYQLTWYIPRRPLRYHYLVCTKHYLFYVGIGPIPDTELICIFQPISFVCTLY